MAVLFHQNMRVFGGGTAARNAAYHASFAAIAGGLGGAGPVAVAGFTEVMNNGAADTAFGPGGVGGGLCAALGVNHIGNIACGQTALANRPEYVAIGVHAGLAVVSVGRLIIHATGSSVSLIHNVSPAIPPPAAWCNQLPNAFTPDYRGLVYVVVNIGGLNIAVGFLHNIFGLGINDHDHRVLVMGQLPYMMTYMGQGIPGIVAKYIGGDFNCDVVDPRGTPRIGICFAAHAGLPGPPAPVPVIPGAPPPPPPPFVSDGTTWRGSLYDYWYTNFDPAGPTPGGMLMNPTLPSVNGTTLDTVLGVNTNDMSDHCATVLQIT